MASKKTKRQKNSSYQAPAPKAKKSTPVRGESPRKGGPTAKAPKAVAQSAKASYTAPKAEATASRAQAQAPRAPKLSATKQWMAFGIIALAVIAGVLFFSFRDAISGGGSGTTDQAGWDLPAYYDSDPDGRVALADFSGTPTVVNFWANWCTTCDAELPDFTAMADRLEGKVDFVFMHSNESERGRAMADRHNLENYNVADDIKGTRRNGLYRDLGGGTSMPGTAFYDAQGNMVQFTASAFNTNSLSQALVANNLISAEELAQT